MARQIFFYDPPDRFVVGTVGAPGERTFFLQARGQGQLTSVVLEKAQVAALAERLDQLLDQIVRASGGTAAVPAVAPIELDDSGPLEQPIVEEFRVGTLSLGWDPQAERIVIQAQAVGPDDESSDDDGAVGSDDADDAESATDAGSVFDDDVDGPDALRVRISGAVARSFVKRALAIVAAGRPPCPLCGQPLDDDHICPRSNGHHPH